VSETATVIRPHADELHAAITAMLGDGYAVSMRQPWEYYSSYPIEELEVQGEGQSARRILFKDLSPAAMLVDAQRAKMEFQCDARREIEVYRKILSPNRLSTPDLVGAVCDQAANRYWLFLEKVEGAPLWQVGDFSMWRAAAQWLAQFHNLLADRAESLVAPAHLLRYDGRACRRWLDRAARFADGADVPLLHRKAVCRIADCGQVLADRIDALPTTVVHGEFYASNILVERPDGAARIRPVDWEMAGVGPDLIDLAALTAGKWTAEQRDEMVAAYRAARDCQYSDLSVSLDVCRLYLAVHCVGCSPSWSPPKEHAFNWLGEAIRLAESLGFI